MEFYFIRNKKIIKVSKFIIIIIIIFFMFKNLKKYIYLIIRDE